MTTARFDFPGVDVYENVTPATFGGEIFPNARPALMKGLVADWPTVKLAREAPERVVAYLKRLDSGALTDVQEAPPSVGGRFGYAEDMHQFNFVTRQARFSDALDQMMALWGRPNSESVFVGCVPVHRHFPDFPRDNPAPLLPENVPPRIWIGGPLRVQTHNDSAFNIACCVAGHRRFVMFPPEQLGSLYIGPFDHNPAGAPVSLASLEEPDFERFPRLRSALETAVMAILEPGDALFIPIHWWHHVTLLDVFNVLVNYWWSDKGPGLDNPNNAFLSGLLSIRDLPGPEKAYWKAMFEHYIFQENGDPVAHIPRDLQSVLGTMGPQLRAQFKQTMLQLITTSERLGLPSVGSHTCRLG